MIDQNYYIGSDLKFKVDITASGFDQDTDEYRIDVYCGNKKLTYTQNDVIKSGNDHYIMINTDLLKTGVIKMVVTAVVNDSDFGSRREVETQTIGVIKSVI